jgi:hypothetical protein
MVKNKPNLFPTLALTGVLSGFLTCASGHFLEMFGSASQDLSLFIGAILGIVFICYWWIFRDFRSIWKSIGFVAASTVAYIFAMFGGLNTPIRFDFLSPLVGSDQARNLAICFTGGIIGGAIFFTSVLVLLPKRTEWKSVPLHASSFSVLSGVLGMIGWGLGPSLGTTAWHLLKVTHLAEQYQYTQSQPSGGANNYYALFLVWQAGAVILVGFFLSKHAVSVGDVVPAKPGQEKSPGSVPAQSEVLSIIFLICVVVSLGYFIRRGSQVHRAQEAYSKRAR